MATTPCDTEPRGHNGATKCAKSGFPVVAGQTCWRCKND